MSGPGMNVSGFFLFASLAGFLPTGSVLEFTPFLVFAGADIEPEENLNVAQEFFWVKFSSCVEMALTPSKACSARISRVSAAYFLRRSFQPAS